MKADPLLDAGLKGHIVNMARRNFWRVAAWYDLEDLIQDGYMCYAKVRRAYPKIKEVKHLTALFKTAFTRHIIDLSNKKRQGEDVLLSQLIPKDSDGNEELESLLGCQQEEQTALVLLHNMPSELRALWRFLRSEDGRQRLREPRFKSRGVRETTNEQLCRLLGYDHNKVNFEELAVDHFYLPKSEPKWVEFFKETLVELMAPEIC